MARFIRNQSDSNGLPPGSFVFIGKQKVDFSRISLIEYNHENIRENILDSADELKYFSDDGFIRWVNIDGIHDTDLIKKAGEIFALHPLHTEDILNTGQRPKIEEYDNEIFIIIKMLDFDEKRKIVSTEQVAMIVKKNLVITFQEQPGDVFTPVRERIRKNRGRIRSSGSDYLAYALLDTIADNYLHIIEIIGDRIEVLEDIILDNPSPSILRKINIYKKEINFISKTVRPVKEAVIRLLKFDNGIISEETGIFFKDLQDLIFKAVDGIDVYREVLSDYFNLYNSLLNNRNNDIFRFLTIFSTVFIPLTFIAGIYGTNFKYLPELDFKYSYYIFLAGMGGIAALMVYIFRKKKWF